MTLTAITHTKFSILGAARSGVAAALLLKRNGGHVFVSEQEAREKRAASAEALAAAGIPCEFGGHSSRVFDADWIVTSPGLPVSHPVLAEAEKRGIPVAGELEAASWFCRSPIVAVTGSNGKSTTTTLIGEVFRTGGKPTVVAGNIGFPFSSVVMETKGDGVAVLEVSSFQLETIHTFRPRVAVVLNLTPDHIDRHGSMEHYCRLKIRIFENQTSGDFTVVNANDALLTDLARNTKGMKALFGKDTGSRCAFIRHGVLTVRTEAGEVPVIEAEKIRIRGEHNLQNAQAAALACSLIGAGPESIAEVLVSFPGLPHRMEFVRVLDGVTWINDSKGTNTDSTWYALGSYSAPVILIAGGKDKDSDFSVLNERIRERVRCVILLGHAADKMERTFRGLVPLKRAGSLSEAVRMARAAARSGDIVLLSPACASFDMFRDFEDRGEQFKELVRGLA